MKEHLMDSKHAMDPTAAGLVARFFRVKWGTAALATTIVAVLALTQLVVAQCPQNQHGASYSAAVPCLNATCAYWSYAIPSSFRANSGTPTCTRPTGITVTKVTVTITATSWAHCQQASNTTAPACNESPASCANYSLYGDNACTVFCQVANFLPTYCEYQ
jgi:hypothetical protein